MAPHAGPARGAPLASEELRAGLGHSKDSVRDLNTRVRLKILKKTCVSHDVAITYCHPATRKALKRFSRHGRGGNLDYGCHCPFRLDVAC